MCDVGAPGYLAAVTIGADGAEHLVLADVDRSATQKCCGA
jgi:hypothetical protein